ncbi:hypothetical protein TGGT1_217920 [Toxoplasma gondii GT1]|uniref:Uncharacterized protein n=3 Tax=Toxoplasma gondii TaxID=5811 RepID=S7WA36_TOXGG|nr:hypothetical protein TGGT1_217920 [Toxoplasma gondii GT1]KAF4638386.1 hypothetical protein TGRH88_059940 [Toxoplasma gondii]RQX71865.1 hypothetical protein TGCAST_217920 [Toxoplasma gondii CAST]
MKESDMALFLQVLCRRELAHLPALPPLVDFGTCMVGEVPEVRIPVRNKGGEAVFTVAHFPCGDKDQELLENSKYELHLPLAIHKPTATANVQHAGNEYQKGHSPDLAISARFKHCFFTLDPASFALKKGEEQEVCVRFASQKAGVFENDYVIRSDSGQTWPLRFKACATSTQIELVQFDGKPWTMQRLFDAEDWYEGERRRDVGNVSFEKATSNWKGEPGGERGQKEAQNGIALRALPNKICFGEVQVDGGVTERRMSLRNRSQLPVKLRWRLLPGHPYAIDIHADGENRPCQFSLNPTSIDLEPGATQEFIFSFKPYKQGIKIRKVAEATAELEVRGFPPQDVLRWQSFKHACSTPSKTTVDSQRTRTSNPKKKCVSIFAMLWLCWHRQPQQSLVRECCGVGVALSPIETHSAYLRKFPASAERSWLRENVLFPYFVHLLFQRRLPPVKTLLLRP